MNAPTNLCILIPAYEPDERLVDLVNQLATQNAAAAIVVVDDGSSPACAPVFEAVAAIPGVSLVRHAINMGKGAALKTGINHCLVHIASPLIITADADGQHLPEDILAVAREALASGEALILGARQFEGPIPLRSRIGNTLTRHIMRLTVGCRLTDTQTGLRTIPPGLAQRLLRLPSGGYEFELDMLILAKQLGIRIVEVPIKTVYLDDNRSSHFDPVFDSMRIYFVLLRFAFTSLATAAVDYSVFAMVLWSTESVLSSQIAARAIALIFNYIAVKRLVFYSDQKHHIVFPRYLLVVLISGAVSYGFIHLIAEVLPVNILAAKLIAESLIFIANFAVLREFIFSRKGPEDVRP